MYRKSTYTHGSRTAAQIAALPTSNIRLYDTVFNTDWKLVETYIGNGLWINEHCIKAESIVQFNVGEPVQWVRTGITTQLETATTTGRYRFAGVCVRSVQTGKSNYTNIIAIKGRWDVRFEESVSRAEYVSIVDGAGRCTASSTSSSSGTGTIGKALETAFYGGGAIRVMCYINGMEKY
tara:strand:- start:1243 stop:1779 length:537 start_codon:yes stop_codon:yes gene_type:complete